PCARMSAGTRSSAMTATAPASSAIFACSASTTSMMTPPFSISARPRLTRPVPTSEFMSSILLGPRLSNFSTRLAEELRQRLRLRDDREEVGVERPPRHDVLVQVVGDARAGDSPLIHADVDPVHFGGVGEHPHGRLGQLADLHELL